MLNILANRSNLFDTISGHIWMLPCQSLQVTNSVYLKVRENPVEQLYDIAEVISPGRLLTTLPLLNSYWSHDKNYFKTSAVGYPAQ